LLALVVESHDAVLVLEEERQSFLPPSRWIQSLSSRRDSSFNTTGDGSSLRKWVNHHGGL
jgi:hypothetical protein